jgi:uncharacterized protein (DUF1330 family)
LAGGDASLLEQVEATMARYGGFYRTWLRHRVEVVEGDFGPHLGHTIVEFPTFEQLWAWYHSEEYAPLKALRRSTCASTSRWSTG